VISFICPCGRGGGIRIPSVINLKRVKMITIITMTMAITTIVTIMAICYNSGNFLPGRDFGFKLAPPLPLEI